MGRWNDQGEVTAGACQKVEVTNVLQALRVCKWFHRRKGKAKTHIEISTFEHTNVIIHVTGPCCWKFILPPILNLLMFLFTFPFVRSPVRRLMSSTAVGCRFLTPPLALTTVVVGIRSATNSTGTALKLIGKINLCSTRNNSPIDMRWPHVSAAKRVSPLT